jgi:hypothetical protein
MDKKTTGIVLTVISALLCGCPGLFICVMGAGIVAGAGTWTFNDQIGSIPSTYGLPIACGGILLVIIPIAVGFFMLRRKPDQTGISNEPLPPAS